MTYEELAKSKGVTTEAMGAKFRSIYPGVRFNKHAEVSKDFDSAVKVTTKARRQIRSKSTVYEFRESPVHPDLLRDEIAKIKADHEKEREKEKRIHEHEVSELRKQVAKKTSSYQWILDAIIFCEMVLIVIGGFRLLGVPGVIVSLIACSFYGHTTIKIRSNVGEDAKTLGLVICLLLSFCFAWLHGQTFYGILREDIAGDDRYYISVGLSWAMTLIPFSALYQTKNISQS